MKELFYQAYIQHGERFFQLTVLTCFLCSFSASALAIEFINTIFSSILPYNFSFYDAIFSTIISIVIVVYPAYKALVEVWKDGKL